jgi:hypothetical protein
LGNRNRAKDRYAVKLPAEIEAHPVRPRFASGKDFALWALNASDDEAPMEIKVRCMQALVAAEAKAAADKPAEPTAPEKAKGGLYAPRGGLAVVGGTA